MKPLPILLGLSLAANATFFFAGAFSHSANEPPLALSPASPPSSSDAPTKSRSSSHTDINAPLWEKLRAGDPSVIARLRAAGWPDDVLRQVTEALVNDLFVGRELAVMRAALATHAEYWKERSFGSFNSKDHLALKQEKESLLKKILGADYHFERDPADQRYAGLSPAKAAALEKITEDYQSLRSEVGGDQLMFYDVRFPEDREKLALLAREERADLACTLTPEELLEYDLRHSNTAQSLRNSLGAFAPSEAEFRAIFAIQQPSDERFIELYRTDPKAAREASAKAKNETDAQLKELLGPDRFADLQRSRDSEYRQLYQICQLLQLPPDTAVNAFAVKTDTDKRLRELKRPPESDAAALATYNTERTAIVDDAEQRLASTLGARGFDAFQLNTGYLKNLRKPPASKK
jgi:hypothetical protein